MNSGLHRYGSGGRKLSLDNQGWLKSLRNKGQECSNLVELAPSWFRAVIGPITRPCHRISRNLDGAYRGRLPVQLYKELTELSAG